jgi:hypothetical protein
MADEEKPAAPDPGGLFPRMGQAVFDFFFAKPGRRAADYSRANLNVKILAALIACLAASWKYINSQQESSERMLAQQQAAYERLVNQMVTQFALQNKEQLAALERLRQAQEEATREQRAMSQTIREAFLLRGEKTSKGTTP